MPVVDPGPAQSASLGVGSGRRLRRARLVTAAVSTLLALCLAEGTLRLLGRRPLAGDPSLALLWRRDPRLGFRNQARADVVNIPFAVRLRTGPAGERLGRSPAGDDPRAPAILFVGDSTTFCAELDDDLTGPAQAMRFLEDPACRAVNAGVRGYSTLQSLRLAEEWLAHQPLAAVVYTYTENDLVENVLPVHLPLSSPVARLVEGGIEVQEVALPAAVDPTGPVVVPGWTSRASAALRRRSALVESLWPLLRPGRDRPGGAPGSGGVTWASLRARAEALGGREVLDHLVKELHRSCAARGAVLIVARFALPRHRSGQDPGWDAVRARCLRDGIPCVDPLDAFHGDEPGYLATSRDGEVDGHYGPLGAETWGRALAPHLARALAHPGTTPASDSSRDGSTQQPHTNR